MSTYKNLATSIFAYGLRLFFFSLRLTSSFNFFKTILTSGILMITRSRRILAKSINCVSFMSSFQVLIKSPLFCCNLKFSGRLSTIMIFDMSLPSFDKSLITKIKIYFNEAHSRDRRMVSIQSVFNEVFMLIEYIQDIICIVFHGSSEYHNFIELTHGLKEVHTARSN